MGRRFFVNLEPVQDSDGLLRRLAADLGLAASGAASEVEAKIAAACARTPTLAILDNLETPWRKDTSATEALLGRLTVIEGLRLVITVRGDTPQLPGPGALTLQDVAQLGEDDARSVPAPCGRPVRRRPCPASPAQRARWPSVVDRAAGSQRRRPGGSQRTCHRLDEAARRDAATIRRGRQSADQPARLARYFARRAQSTERSASPCPPDGAVAGRHV